jgi:exonuclease I
MAELIGGDVSATEFKDRIDLAVTRVNNADPLVKTQLKAFYNIQDADLVGYFLSPKENLPKLEEKVKAAEIGSAAALQNLGTSLATAEDLAKFGVDLATARRGYAAIANVLPTAEKLGQIYSEEGVVYDQATAEAETFKGLASAQRKRLQLAEKEIAAFSGRSGVNRASLTQGSAGQI